MTRRRKSCLPNGYTLDAHGDPTHVRSKYRIAKQYIEGKAYIEAELYRHILRIRYIFDSICASHSQEDPVGPSLPDGPMVDECPLVGREETISYSKGLPSMVNFPSTPPQGGRDGKFRPIREAGPYGVGQNKNDATFVTSFAICCG